MSARRSTSRWGSSRTLGIGLTVLVLVYIAWVRLPPRVSLLNNPAAKKVLVELSKSQKTQQQWLSGSQYDELAAELLGEEAYIDEDENKDIDEKIGEENPSPDVSKDDDSISNPTLAKYDIDPTDTTRKYFVYQPSGGWGNQRMILRWALRVANAMDRTLILPMIAPHNKMWYGYDRLNATEMIPADRILDMEALEAGTTQGVRVHRNHLRTLPSILPGSWRRNSVKSTMWLTENAIRSRWRSLSERVIFWNKGSMWECCAGGTMMTPYIMFNRPLKVLSLELAEQFFDTGPFNAVHVRRGGGHTRLDRRTAQHYFEMKLRPNNFEKSLPIYIATDEKNKTWFDYWKTQGFKLVFWSDLVRPQSSRVLKFLKTFPPKTHNDVIGFLEQLICARAKRWTGSDGSTFSFSIEGLRNFPTLTKVDWQTNMDTAARRIYAHDGRGVTLNTRESEAESEAEGQAPQYSDEQNVEDETQSSQGL